MAEAQSRIRHIACMDLFPWLGLVRAVRLAFAPRMLVLAACGLFATATAWDVIGPFCSGTEDKASKSILHQQLPTWPLVHFWPEPPPRSLSLLDPANSPARIPWNDLSDPFRRLFDDNVTLPLFTYLLLLGIWALLVWSIFGAAISRGAALWFAREDRLSLRHSVLWGVRKWPAYFGGPMFPLAGVLIAVIPVALLCLLLKIDIFVLLVGIVWPVALLCGLFVAILLVGLLFGWPLMWPTISAEGTDSFDALSRSYSYTYQRPLHYLFYAAAAGILGMLAWIVVVVFANGVITYSYWAASWGSGGKTIDDIRQIAEALPALPEPAEASPGFFFWAGSKAIGFWADAVKYLAVGFLFSYFWCAATYVYFLLRQSVDATEMD